MTASPIAPCLALFAVLFASHGGRSRCCRPLSGPITVHPADGRSSRHHRQPQSLQVLGTTADGYSLDLRPQAKFASADPKIATVDEAGWVRPVANGQTQ